MIYIPYIKLYPLVPWKGIPTIHLCPTGNARLHLQPSPLKRRVLGHLIFQRRSWADKAHLSFEHIQQLRQLIKAPHPQKRTDACDPLIIRRNGYAESDLLRPKDHGAKLICSEKPSLISHSWLDE